jgi:hypothetical protein
VPKLSFGEKVTLLTTPAIRPGIARYPDGSCRILEESRGIIRPRGISGGREAEVRSGDFVKRKTSGEHGLSEQATARKGGE